MLKPVQLHSIATQMRAAQIGAIQLEPFTAQLPDFDLTSAYAVAQLMHEARIADGALPVGRKIGFTNESMWTLYGVRHPIWAFVYADTAQAAPKAGVTCSLGRFVQPKIEPEIVVHLRSAPVDGRVASLLESIDWVAHAFEIVQSHFPGWRFQAADAVADWSLHGALLLGDPVPLEQLAPDPVAALESFSLVLSCDGDVRDVGKGSNVLGSPLTAMSRLVQALLGTPGYPPLQANEIVTTGTVTRAQGVRPGEVWETQLDGIALGGLAVEFAS